MSSPLPSSERTAVATMLWQRPFTFGTALEYTLQIYSLCFCEIIMISAVVLLPVQIIGAALSYLLTREELALENSEAQQDDSSQQQMRTLVGWMIATLIIILSISVVGGSLACGAITKTVADIYVGKNPEWRGSVSHSFRRLCALLVGALLVAVGSVMGFAVPILIGDLIMLRISFLLGLIVHLAGYFIFCFLLTSWSVVEAAIIVEDISGMKSLGRSWAIISGHCCAVFCIFFTMGLVIFLVGFVVFIIFVGSNSTVVRIAGVALSFLTAPLFYVAKAVIYIGLRQLKEGLTREQLAEQIGFSPSGELDLPLAGASVVRSAQFDQHSSISGEGDICGPPRNDEPAETTENNEPSYVV